MIRKYNSKKMRKKKEKFRKKRKPDEKKCGQMMCTKKLNVIGPKKKA